jgi:hypothetical protein
MSDRMSVGRVEVWGKSGSVVPASRLSEPLLSANEWLHETFCLGVAVGITPTAR